MMGFLKTIKQAADTYKIISEYTSWHEEDRLTIWSVKYNIDETKYDSYVVKAYLCKC